MKKQFLIYLLMALMASLGLSCSKDEKKPADPADAMKELFKAESQYGAYSINASIFLFDRATCQLAFNANKRSFRLQNDDQSKFFGLTLSEAPVAGKAVKAAFVSQAIVSIEPGERTLDVLKIEGPKIWLWSGEAKQGFIIRLD